MGLTNRDAYKSALPGLKAGIPTRGFELEEMAAEGNSVVTWGCFGFTLANGKQVSGRLVVRYRVANGLIIEDGPFTTPPLSEVLRGVIPSK